jgi:two-component system nitrogen regulation response regulator GlnG
VSVILVVDDDAGILDFVGDVFEGSPHRLVKCTTAADGIAAAAREQPDVVLLDVQLPDESGLEVFTRIHRLDPRTPVIFMTGHASTDMAIEATKLGAMDYLFKPIEPVELRQLVARAVELSRLTREAPALAIDEPADTPGEAIVGRCPAMKDVYVAIGRVAPQDVTVLILGPSGTGKELVARAIYHHSRRCRGPYRTVNCAAIPETLLESELFGHEKGAFTGADRLRVGKFEQSSGGTLFLDEVGDMTPLTQAKILRVLQDGQFERVGGNETLQTDVRIVAATNRNLEQLVAEGRFRADLYYRLSVFSIRMPPLAQRGDDLRLLTEHFVARYSRELGKHIRQVAPEVHQLLRQYPWPGNVRELQSVVKQALLYASGPVLIPEFLPPSVRGGAVTAKPAGPATPGPGDPWQEFVDSRLREGTSNLYAEWLAAGERPLMEHVMSHTGGNLSEAARLLGINRRTLRIKLRMLGIAGPAEE